MGNIIKTPFGEIDLNPIPISFWITNSTIGAKRRVDFEGVISQSQEEEFAQIVWKIWQFGEDQETLKNELDAVQGRVIITTVSGQNRVTSDGILITRESFPEGEVGERAYQLAMSSGHNEYHYWMALLRVAPLPTVIQIAGAILTQFNRYDRL